MKIIVAGGAGFIGSHMCDRLIQEGHHVVCLDNLQTGSITNVASLSGHPNFEFVEADIRDEFPDIEADQLYNLACPAAPQHYQIDPIGTLRTCVVGTLNALEYCQRHGARLLQASTSEIYGDPTVHPQPEKYVGAVNCTGPRACYDEGKRAAETACFDFNRQYGVEIRVARIFNTYGPRMSVADGRVVPNFVTQAMTGQDLTIYGSGSQTRSFCYVDDTVDGLIRLMNAEGSSVGPVNIGNDEEMSILQLARLVIEMTGTKSDIRFVPYNEAYGPGFEDTFRRVPSLAKLEALLGYRPRTPLRDVLAMVAEEMQPGFLPRQALQSAS